MSKYCITSDGKRIPLDGSITYGYDEDGVCHVSWNALPVENGGDTKTWHDLAIDLQESIGRDRAEIVRIAIATDKH